MRDRRYWAEVACPYFRLKRSTRPSLSTNFCLPVKNGWQDEQISTWISDFVLLVWKLFPHAQLIVQSTYSGWISFRTKTLLILENGAIWRLARDSPAERTPHATTRQEGQANPNYPG